MTPEHRQIHALERKMKFMRSEFYIGIAFGAVLFPRLLEELDLPDPVYRLQVGLLMGILLMMLVSAIRNVRDARRDAALRQQDFANSIFDVIKQ